MLFQEKGLMKAKCDESQLEYDTSFNAL